MDVPVVQLVDATRFNKYCTLKCDPSETQIVSKVLKILNK